jgi:predicted dehydrogenase
MATQPTIRFSVIGINHGHIYGQVNLLLRAGAELVDFYAKEPELAAQFSKAYPQARQVHNPDEIFNDATIQMVVTAAIPKDRAGIGIAAMQHGKDVMTDKPGFTTLDQLAEVRRVQAETKRIYSICFSERLESAATIKAGELVRAGAIGQVVQTVGLGPHQTNLSSRPSWFFERESYGGILCDIASHQVDQFLFFTGSTSGEVVASQVANYKHPEHLGLEDFGEVMLRGEKGSGYIRVDWYTPKGLGVWGDVRLTILGTEGYIELRKNIDICGQPGDQHLFLVDQNSSQYVDCKDQYKPYGPQLINDVLNRTETAMPQEHVFLASELVLKAQAQATRLGNLK